MNRFVLYIAFFASAILVGAAGGVEYVVYQLHQKYVCTGNDEVVVCEVQHGH